ncbi:MAG: IclR family transcriptional regulator [Bauldia sp.]|nr:IclR family transcriptional regulator [Bauldia sp.]
MPTVRPTTSAPATRRVREEGFGRIEPKAGPNSTPKASGRGINRSVARALDILVDVSRSGASQSFVDLQLKMKLPKASLHKLLFTLETLGFLRRDETGRYSVGWSTYELAGTTTRPGDVLTVIAPVMRRLVAKYNETGHIGVLDGTDEIIIDRIDPPQQVVRLAIARRHPAYCTSGGLAALALRGEAALQLLPDRLTPRTPNTIRTRKALVTRLSEIRQAGYAFDCEEAYAGVRCVGVAIDAPGWPVASMSFSLPLQRGSFEKLRELARPLMAAAKEVEETLAGVPSRATSRGDE